MGAQTAIAWTDRTFNPWIGCARVSPGCANCYAETLTKRTGMAKWGVNGTRTVTSNSYWRQPLKWDRAAVDAGRPALVFCASLADVFERRHDVHDARQRLFELIEQTPHLIWQLLTKRPENVRDMVPVRWLLGDPGWPSNVWIGTTVEDQQRADERIPWLLDVPAPVRFLSCEPLLGHVDLSDYAPIGYTIPTDYETGTDYDIDRSGAVDWVIIGGESGPHHRKLNLDDARDLVHQCEAWDIPVFFKQIGGARPTSGGDQLDGRTIKQFPVQALREHWKTAS